MKKERDDKVKSAKANEDKKAAMKKRKEDIEKKKTATKEATEAMGALDGVIGEKQGAYDKLDDDAKAGADGVALLKALNEKKDAKTKLDGEMKEFKKQEKELDDARLAEEKSDADSALFEAKEKKEGFKNALAKAEEDFTRLEGEKERLADAIGEAQHQMMTAKSNDDYQEAEAALAKLNGEMTAATTGFEQAKMDTTNYQKDFDTAAADETNRTNDRKEKWTAAGFDPNDKSFEEGPPATDGANGQGKGDPNGQGGNADGKDPTNGSQGGQDGGNANGKDDGNSKKGGSN